MAMNDHGAPFRTATITLRAVRPAGVARATNEQNREGPGPSHQDTRGRLVERHNDARGDARRVRRWMSRGEGGTGHGPAVPTASVARILIICPGSRQAKLRAVAWWGTAK